MTSCLPLFDCFQEHGRLLIEGEQNPSSCHPVLLPSPACTCPGCRGCLCLAHAWGERFSPWSGKARDLVSDCTVAWVGWLKGFLSSAMLCVPFLLAGKLCLLLNFCDLLPGFSLQAASDFTFTAVSQLALLKGQLLLL